MASYTVHIKGQTVRFNHKADEGEFVVISPSYGKMGAYVNVEAARMGLNTLVRNPTTFTTGM